MKWTQCVYMFGICTVIAAVSVANAQVINNENACTWGISNDELPIPSGSIITQAVLVLSNVRSTQSDAGLYVQLLDNPDSDLKEITDTQSGNYFGTYGTLLREIGASELSSTPQTITLDLSEIDNPDCWTHDIFATSPVVTLADSTTVTCSSALLSLFDYAGTGRSFGFGLDCDGVAVDTMTLNLTIASTTELTESTIVTFTVGELNNAPVLQTIDDQTVTEMETLQFTVDATDVDGDSLTYSASGLPDGASFTHQTFSWTPGYRQAGTYQVTISTGDGLDSDSQAVTINVLDMNQSPILTRINSQTVSEGQQLSFVTSATDPDGDAVILNAENLPEGAIFTSGIFSWTPGYDQSGTYTVTIIASDGILSDTASVTITVNNTNRAPVLEAIADQTVTAPDTLSLSLSCSDADGDTVTLTAQNLPGNAAFVGDTLTFSPTSQQAGDYQVTFIANDGNGGTDTVTVTITVEAEPVAAEWSELLYDDFENGLGNYTDGGKDCKLYTATQYAHQGSNAMNIQDNSSDDSSFYLTNGIDLSSKTELKIEFWYMPVSMDNSNEDFMLDYWDGSKWITLKKWAKDTDFQNNTSYFESVTLTNADVTFASDVKIRFVCDASSNYDDVYIDEIRISAK